MVPVFLSVGCVIFVSDNWYRIDIRWWVVGHKQPQISYLAAAVCAKWMTARVRGSTVEDGLIAVPKVETAITVNLKRTTVPGMPYRVPLHNKAVYTWYRYSSGMLELPEEKGEGVGGDSVEPRLCEFKFASVCVYVPGTYLYAS